MGSDSRPRVVLLGAGNRGRTYADWILRNPGRLRVVAVAEPDGRRREYIQGTHGLPDDSCFGSWEEAVNSGLRADAAIIATQDAMHTAPATRCLERGYHVLLEKPMATSREEVTTIAEAARGASGSLTVCHVLRYSSLFKTAKKLIEEGRLGDIQSIFLAENVSYYHFAHSYVRGNWRNSKTSSPLILAKSCHDLDIICWLADSPPVSISSFAGRSFFTAANAPPGAPARCTDGCPVGATCIYEAEQSYLRGVPLKTAVGRGSGPLAWAARFSVLRPRLASLLPGLGRYSVWRGWPTSTIANDLTEKGIQQALREGPYGRCVFGCDNNQPDHQETIISFASGITASFRLHGRSHEEGRTLRIDGSKATLRGRFGSGTVLEICPHGAGSAVRIPVTGERLGHSEADSGIMEAWSAFLAGQEASERVSTDAATALGSHLLAFAAHESVQTGETQTL